jgi:predicted nucleic acid-binding protein
MSAAGEVFLDTNLLVYPFDRMEVVKGPLADSVVKRIFAAGRPVISTQVLSEFYWSVTRKIATKLSHDEACAEVQRLINLTRVAPLTLDLLERALQAIPKHQLPLWDALVFAAAILNGARYVLSEDFQHGRTAEGVTFLNPLDPAFDLSSLSIP